MRLSYADGVIVTAGVRRRWWVRATNGNGRIRNDVLGRHGNELSQLVSEIVYKDEYFSQTENENAYIYSPYADLLGIDS